MWDLEGPENSQTEDSEHYLVAIREAWAWQIYQFSFYWGVDRFSAAAFSLRTALNTVQALMPWKDVLDCTNLDSPEHYLFSSSLLQCHSSWLFNCTFLAVFLGVPMLVCLSASVLRFWAQVVEPDLRNEGEHFCELTVPDSSDGQGGFCDKV